MDILKAILLSQTDIK